MFNLSRQLSFVYAAFALIVIVGTAYFIGYNSSPLHKSSAVPVEAPAVNDSQNCDYNLPRLGGYNYIKPLMFTEQECESEKYLPLKNKIAAQIEQFKRDGILTNASVYFRDLNSESWMSINGDEKFDPGSLLKVPLLITVLRIAEDKPAFMEQQIPYAQPFNLNRAPVYKSKEIEAGKSYTVRELLEHMIIYSDNNATMLLINAVDDKEFTKTYTDMGFEPVKKHTENFRISPKQYAVFLTVLYDGGYLTFKDCEYATTLLTKCDFKEGVVAGIPPGIKVAHKFGEGGSYDAHVFELHEAAMVYLNNNPYSLTVMTQGADLTKLPGVMKSISKLTFEAISGGAQVQ